MQTLDNPTFVRRWNVRAGLANVGLRTARTALKSAGVALPRGSSRWSLSARVQWVTDWSVNAPTAEIDGVYAFFRRRAVAARQPA